MSNYCYHYASCYHAHRQFQQYIILNLSACMLEIWLSECEISYSCRPLPGFKPTKNCLVTIKYRKIIQNRHNYLILNISQLRN